MKKIKKGFMTFALGAALASTVVLSSCGNKTVSYTFNVNGGSDIEGTKVTVGSDYTLPTPTREGYAFEGWYSNQDFTGEAITSIKPDSDTLFYAKWSKLHTITLDANGGTLAATTLSVKEGANVVEALKNSTPSYGTTTFDGWYNGDTKVADTLTVTCDLTLTAKYSQSYSREYYYEKLDGTGYDKEAGEAGKALLGTTVNDTNTKDGFSLSLTEEQVSSVKVSEDASSNVIKKYYTRNTFTVTFDSNYPQALNLDNETVVSTVKYGNDVEVKSDFKCDGFLLMGYSTAKDGELEYSVDAIKKLFNLEETGITNTTTVTPSASTTYYAVWAKAYTNMFTGSDKIYVLDTNSNRVYLERSGYYFAGEYYNDDKSFTFRDVNDDILIEGKLNEDGTYAYSNEVRKGKSYSLFTGSSLDSNVTLHFDEYNGFKYAVMQGENQTVYEGKYSFNADGTFHGVYTAGEKAGEEINFTVGTYKSANAFQIRNEADVALGEFVVFYVNGTMMDINPNFTFKLPGYGVTSFGSTSYYYTYNEEAGTITLVASSGQVAGVLKIVEINGEKGVAVYTEAYDHEYVQNDKKLTLDGIGNAYYTDSDYEFAGVYKVSSTFLGKKVVTVYQENGEETRFTISQNTVDEVTSYSFAEISAYYNEYVYQDAAGAYYVPMLVTETETEAYLYAMVSKTEFIPVSKGTYTYDNVAGRYTYKATEALEVPADKTFVSSTVDPLKVKEFTYNLYEGNGYTATYWYTVKYTDDTQDSFEHTYTYKKDDGSLIETTTLYIVANKAVFDNKSESNKRHYEGTVTVSDNIYTLSFPDDMTMTVEINTDDNTFTMVNKPHDDYLFQNQQIVKTEYLSFNKAGEVTYVVVTQDEEGNDVYTKYPGTYDTANKTSRAGSPIYVFTSDDITFEFIRLSNSSASYFAKYDESLDITFTNSSTGETIALDGFGFYAVYTYGENQAKVMYTLVDSVLTVTLNSNSFIYDVNLDDKTMEQRGGEAGSYLVLENQAFVFTITLDGHGKAKLFKVVSGEQVTISDNATYVIYDASSIKLTYTVDGETTIAIYKYAVKKIGTQSYKAFSRAHSEGAMQLVDKEDWSVMILTEFGTAELYGSDGVLSTGTYLYVDDNLLYFMNDDGASANTYKYNKETGIMSKEGSKLIRGYYSEDFESLIFTKYGYAVTNSTEGSYYYVEDGICYLYTYDKTNANANKYGYVKTEFGEFDNVKEFNGVTYYKNTGYDIEFKRIEENVGKYPVTVNGEKKNIESLYFAPTGKEFNVSGRIKIEDEYYNCTVVRKLVEDDYISYVILPNGNTMYINIAYHGIDDDDNSASTFEVTAMNYELSLRNYNFLYMCYYYYYLTQQNALKETDPYGGIKISIIYGEDGEIKESYLDSYFTEKSNIVDSNGKVLNFNKAAYTMNTKDSTIYILATVLGSDDINYTFYMQTAGIQYPEKEMGIAVVYVTRPQTLTTADGYKLDINQIVYYSGESDVTKSSYVGQVYGMKMTKDDVEIEASQILFGPNGETYMIVREYDEESKLITSTKYYKIDLTKEVREDNYAPQFTEAKVEEMNATTYYSEDNTAYVDILPDGTMLYLSINGSFVAYSNYKYDETTKIHSFSVTADDGSKKNYTLEIKDGKAVVTETTVAQSEETEE